MSFIKLGKSLFETSTIIARKSVTYVSSSNETIGMENVTGSIRLSKNNPQRVRKTPEQFAGVTELNEDNQKIPSEVVGNEHITPTVDRNTVTKFITASFFNYTSTVRGKQKTDITLMYPYEGDGVADVNGYVANTINASKVNVMNNQTRTINGLNGVANTNNGLIETEYVDYTESPENRLYQLSGEGNSINDDGSAAILKKTLAKKYVTNVLMPFYKSRYTNCDFSYKNYLSLNFFTASNHTQQEVLVYNNDKVIPIAFNRKEAKGNEQKRFNSSNNFTTSFWINPKYTSDRPAPDGHMSAGTILHLSSSLAISLVTGSSLDSQGYPDKFRIMVQLSHSADMNPSEFEVLNNENRVNNRVRPHDLIYLTGDNALDRNTWNYVSVKFLNFGSDAKSKLTLRVNDYVTSSLIPSSSVTSSYTSAIAGSLSGNEDKVFVGNYYDGETSQIKHFFSKYRAAESFAKLDETVDVHSNPNFKSGSLNPLNAELNEIRIFASYLDDVTENKYRYEGLPREFTKPTDLDAFNPNLNFYVPVFYAHVGQPGSVDTAGAVPTSPFVRQFVHANDSLRYRDAKPPFNPYFSNGIGGRYINLHNFVKNFVKNGTGNCRPILFQLSASAEEPGDLSFNEVDVVTHLGSQGSVSKRNNMILPCDNGLFKPNYFFHNADLYNSFPSQRARINEIDASGLTRYHENDLENRNFDTISLRHSISSSKKPTTREKAQIYLNQFPIASLTKDVTSNDISLFSISNLFYGERIHPGSFSIEDKNISGSDGKIKIKIKDDGKGGLYRCDSKSDHAMWNTVGNIFYDEGLVIFKSPHPVYFGLNSHEIKFKGEHSTHVTTINVPCPQDLFTSSSNTSYQVLTASNINDDKMNEFVYIDAINIHDDNLNVIMKATLSQPIKKRKSDSFMFRLKQDF